MARFSNKANDNEIRMVVECRRKIARKKSFQNTVPLPNVVVSGALVLRVTGSRAVARTKQRGVK